MPAVEYQNTTGQPQSVSPANPLPVILSGSSAVSGNVLPAAQLTLTATGETTLYASGGAGVFHDLSSIVIANSSSSKVTVTIRDATAAPAAGRITFEVPAGETRGIAYPKERPQRVADNNWTAELSSAVTDVKISAVFVKRS